MKKLPLIDGALLLALAFGTAAAGAAPARKTAGQHDYPTTERVQFVQDCMLDHPGARYEMLTKCSCALDTIARKVDLDDFVSMSTAVKATTIGGEQGNSIRDTPMLQNDIKRFRELLSNSKKSCFIEGDPVKR